MPFHSEIVKSVNTLVKLAASQNKCTLEEADAGEEDDWEDDRPKKKAKLPRYLSYCHIVIYISPGLNKFYLVPKGLFWSTKTCLQKQEEKNGFFLLNFLWRLHTKIYWKPTLFGRYHTKKPKKWHFDRQIWGGGWYQSSIGICWGPEPVFPMCMCFNFLSPLEKW